METPPVWMATLIALIVVLALIVEPAIMLLSLPPRR